MIYKEWIWLSHVVFDLKALDYNNSRKGDKQNKKDKDKQLTHISSYLCELIDWSNWWTKLKLEAIDTTAAWI